MWIVLINMKNVLLLKFYLYKTKYISSVMVEFFVNFSSLEKYFKTFFLKLQWSEKQREDSHKANPKFILTFECFK